MGWLDEREIKHRYKKKDGTLVYLVLLVSEEPPPKFKGGVYDGFDPDKMSWTLKVQFERNGRIGYKYDHGDGKTYTRSATRERWEHNAGNLGGKAYKEMGNKVSESVYAPGLKNAMKEEKKRMADAYNYKTKRRRA